MSLRRALIVFASIASLAAAGCDGNPPPADSGPTGDAGDAGVPGDAQLDGALPDGDAGPRPDGGGGTVVRTCPGASLPPLASGDVCEATAGDGNLLITGDILRPDEVLAGGQVLVDTTGTIVCADCDCSTHALAAGATRLVCPDGVVSPGLVNTHDHITFQGDPPVDTGDRSEQRHDWRRGLNGHLRISSMMATSEQMRWAELRQVMGGATSLNGSGGQAGFLRNLDRAIQEGLGQPQVEYDTFPLDDASGIQRATGCDYGAAPTTAAQIAAFDAYTPHISEGIDGYAHNEFVCLSMGATDLIQPNTALIHGIALTPGDMEVVATDQAMLIWSPRSNVFLYGDTARVREYDRMGVPIALGTDWIFSGSMNMLRELACADSLNAEYFDGYFSDEDLWRMATLNGAIATATDDVIGAISVGRVADLAIFDGSVQPLHRAVIEARPEGVALVLRSGLPLYGESAVVPLLRMGDACDTLDVCGAERRVCAMREIGVSLAALQTANASSYPLFFCDGATPTNEPTCVPERMEPLGPDYTGEHTADDPDGDGVPSAMDNCPTVFNPGRPMDLATEQADADMDDVGDSCDPCPLDAFTTTCAAPSPNDRDRDMVDDSLDNCPGLANMDQADADSDMKGDACDACPMDANPGSAPCPATIYDVKDGTVAIGSRVIVRGVVTALATNGFYAQVPTTDPDYTVPDFSGVFVYTGGAPTVVRGDLVSIDGNVARFPTTGTAYQIQFDRPMVMAMGTAAIPAPVVVEPAEIATGGARAAQLEAVLVRVDTVAVSATCDTTTCSALPPGGTETAPTYEFQVDGSLLVDDLLFRITPFPVTGETFASITGVLTFRQSNSKLEPRDGDDVIAGSASLLSLEPALSYVREGAAAGPTFPAPLTVRLTRAVATDTVVTMMSSTGATVADVTIPAGMSSAVVPVAGTTASASPVTITATLGTDVRMAQVRVLAAAEAPTDFTLSPATATVRVGTGATFTVTTDIPAPPGGTTITLTEDTGGTLPVSVVVPADATTATFTFTAGATAGTGTLTATMGSVMRTAALTISAGVPGTIVINEIDYDQPSVDAAEFVELHNPGVSDFDLTNVVVVMVNGTGSAEYARAALSGTLPAGGYLVVGVTGQTLALPAGVTRVNLTGSSATSIQNGAPDGVAVIRTTDGALLDALSYEGAITAATIGGMTYSLVEGTALTTVDDGTTVASLARSPNGSDTDDASADWVLSTRVTPGASNDM